MLHVKRLTNPDDGYGYWVFFETGNIARPVAMLTDSEMDVLLDDVEAQREEKERKERKNPALQVDGTVAKLRAMAGMREVGTGMRAAITAAANLLEAAAAGTPLWTDPGWKPKREDRE